MRFQHLKRWRLTADLGYQLGAERSSFLTHKWDVSGNCQSPVYREYYGAESVKHSRDGLRNRERGPIMTIEFQARCRCCAACLKARAAHWRMKAQTELRQSPRTWFGTLTFRPDQVYRAKCAVHLRLAARGTEWSQLKEGEAFRLMAEELGKEVTRFLKRARKRGASLRYCLVVEAHKTGVPHFHMLAHEVSETAPVRHKLLADCWTAGFSAWKLADERSAHYVTKYLTKSMSARIRASIGYGLTNPNPIDLRS